MGMSGGAHSGVFGRRRHRRSPVMAEINVTPMVDVMLVLLIIFMVSAPLLTVGVPIDLPQTQASSLDQADKEPLAVSVNTKGQIFLQNSEIPLEELVPKLQAIAQARGTVTLGGHPVHLTPTQYRLLVALASRTDEVLSRETLGQIVWGYQDIGTGHLIDVHIGRL